MAIKSYMGVNIGTSEATVMTATVNTAIAGLQVINKLSTATTVTVTITRDTTVLTLVPAIEFPAKMPYDPLEGSKIFLNAGDIIKAVASQASAVDILVSVNE